MFRIKRGRRTNVEREPWQEDKYARDNRGRWTNMERET